jgi:hypothetical protein
MPEKKETTNISYIFNHWLLIDPEDYSKKSEKEFLEDTSQIT